MLRTLRYLVVVADARTQGTIARAVERAGLRGAAP
jgi:hypothetical protein